VADAFVLSEADVKVLQDSVGELRRMVQNIAGRAVPRPDDPEAPEVYIALTPSGGIPARSGVVLGSASCDVYKVISDSLLSAGFTRTVYNLSTTAVAGSIYVQVKRDKFGTWLAEQPSGSGGSCSSVTVSETDIRCEDQVLNRYTRDITFLVNSAGCLVKGIGAWILDRALACCDPSCLPGGVYTGTGTGTGTFGDFECGPCGPCNPFPCEPCLVFGGGMANGECSDCITDLPEFVRLYEAGMSVTTCQWYGSFTLCGSTWNITFGYIGRDPTTGDYRFTLEICDTVSIDCVQYETTIPVPAGGIIDCLQLDLFKTGQANTGTPKCTWPSSIAIHPCSSPGTGTGGGGGGDGGDIEITGLGTATSSGVSVASLSKTVTVTAGLLVVNVGRANNGNQCTATYDGAPMTESTSGINFLTASGGLQQFYLAVSDGSGDVVITANGIAILEMQVINVTGLVDNTIEAPGIAKDRGASSTPDTGVTGTTGTANTAVIAFFWLYSGGSPNIGAFTWGGTPTMTSGSQDVTDTWALSEVVLTEGRYIASAVGTFQAALVGITPAEWAGMVVAYK
jgi:hypothetical protein